MAPKRPTGPSRRRLLRTAAASLATVTVAGCLDDSTGGGGDGTTDRGTSSTDTPDGTTGLPTTEPPIEDTPSTARTPTPKEDSRPRPTDGDPTDTVYPTNEVSYDHPIVVENRTNAETSVVITVEEPREEETDEGTVYHAETYTVAAHAEREVFNVESLDLAGDRRLTVTATYEGRTERMTIRTTTCYGTVLVYVSPEDGFGMTYSVC
ncbi:hypothetical protein ACFPYI_07725 [Halomarina salina]|uniref:Uncharacterized protein n=1 Tax=Halomarina salina TaxID=1872699 RepID=A0ABD5RLI9_9EURY|nr:hypothetical protein [Halomarina salina]